jgi:hypothetical protein
MGNIKIRNLDGSESIDVTTGNFLPMALSTDDGHERLTKKVTLEQVVSGGAAYADFSNQLKLSGNSVLTGFEIAGFTVISGDQFKVNFGGLHQDDHRDVNLYQGGQEKISIRDNVTFIGSNDPSNDSIEIINPTTITEGLTVEDEVLTILGGETILKDRVTFDATGNFTDTSHLTFGNNPENSLQDLLGGVSINSLSDIGDVSATAATAGQVLKWDGTNSQWAPATDNAGIGSVSWDDVLSKPTTFSPSDHALSSHSDVSAAAATAGQVLKWDDTNSQWAPATDNAGSVGSTSWDDIDSKPEVFAPEYPLSLSAGEHLIYDTLSSRTVTNKKLLVVAAAPAKTDQLDFSEEFNRNKLSKTFEDIFDNFYRFSHVDATDQYRPVIGNHGGREAIHANQTTNEEAGWFLNPNKEISQPTNSHSVIGFASRDLYDTYNASVLTRSTDSDDDTIGWVIALNRGAPNDDDANTPYDSTLSVYRFLSGPSTGIGIYYNLGLPGQKSLALVTEGFTNSQSNVLGGNGWLGYNGCPIKIQRTPDTVKVWAVDNASSSPEWDDPSWVFVAEIDLGSDPDLVQFKNPSSWGLLAASQRNCTWKDLYINTISSSGESTTNPNPDPNLTRHVFDLEADKAYVYSNGVFVEQASESIHDFVDDGQLLYDITTKSLSIKDSGRVIRLISNRMDFTIKSGNDNISVEDDGSVIRLDQGCSQITFDASYGPGFQCKLLNYSGADVSLVSSGNTKFQNDSSGSTLTLPNNMMAECIGNGFNLNANISVFFSALT